jgi:hypothetical protein
MQSFDSTDSLERLEAPQQYGQQFLETTANFDHDQAMPSTPALPSTPAPQAVRSWPPASQDHEDNAQFFLVPPANQIEDCSALSDTSETSSSVPFISLQMQPTYVTDSEALEIDKTMPVCKQVNASPFAVPFMPPEWVKLPVTSGGQTDEVQSQISLLPSSTLEMAESSKEPTSDVEPLLTSSSLFHSDPVTEGNSSHGAFTSSLPHLEHQGQGLSDVSTDRNLSSEGSTRQAIHPQNAPNAMAMTGFSTQSYFAQSCLTEASSFHFDHVTEGSTSDGASVSSLPYLKRQEQRINNAGKIQNLSSEGFAREVIQPQNTPNIPLSPQKQTDSVNFDSIDGSENKYKRVTSRFQSEGQTVRRFDTTSSRTSFTRRSQTPSIPVKTLIKKFSANN